MPVQQIGHFTGLGGQGGWGLMTGQTDKSVPVAAPALSFSYFVQWESYY